MSTLIREKKYPFNVCHTPALGVPHTPFRGATHPQHMFEKVPQSIVFTMFFGLRQQTFLSLIILLEISLIFFLSVHNRAWHALYLATLEKVIKENC